MSEKEGGRMRGHWGECEGGRQGEGEGVRRDEGGREVCGTLHNATQSTSDAMQ